MSHNPTGLHGQLQDSFTFTLLLVVMKLNTASTQIVGTKYEIFLK
jgi:hypothetical protein